MTQLPQLDAPLFSESPGVQWLRSVRNAAAPRR